MALSEGLAHRRPTDSVGVRAAAEPGPSNDDLRSAAAIRMSARMCSRNTEGYDKQSFPGPVLFEV